MIVTCAHARRVRAARVAGSGPDPSNLLLTSCQALSIYLYIWIRPRRAADGAAQLGRAQLVGASCELSVRLRTRIFVEEARLRLNRHPPKQFQNYTGYGGCNAPIYTAMK